MEQKIWYPSLKKNGDAGIKKLIKHLIGEEKLSAKAIKKFKSVKTQDEWEERFDKLRMDVEQHASEEEEKLFPKVKKTVNVDILNSIGPKLQKFKNQFTD
jgi:iron-sulfur cluster repair protein YtfE (RIC family)